MTDSRDSANEERGCPGYVTISSLALQRMVVGLDHNLFYWHGRVKGELARHLEDSREGEVPNPVEAAAMGVVAVEAEELNRHIDTEPKWLYVFLQGLVRRYEAGMVGTTDTAAGAAG